MWPHRIYLEENLAEIIASRPFLRRSFLVSKGLVHNGKGARTFPNDGMGLSFQVLETCITATIKLGLNGLEAAKIISGPGRVPFQMESLQSIRKFKN